MGFELFDRGAEVFDLEGETGPSAFALSAPVNTDDAVGHLDLGPDFRLHSDLSIKEIAIKGDGALPIGSPESVFGFEDGHGRREWVGIVKRQYLGGVDGGFRA